MNIYVKKYIVLTITVLTLFSAYTETLERVDRVRFGTNCIAWVMNYETFSFENTLQRHN